MSKAKSRSDSDQTGSELLSSIQFAAAAGNSDALIVLATLYETGYLLAKDLAKAQEIYARAAALGSTYSMHRLSRVFNLTPASVSAEQAFAWARKAADANYAPAVFDLGRYYERGTGICADLGKAREFFEQAAEMGYGPAAAYLAMNLELGTWGEKDHKQAAHFASLAASLGMSNAAQLLGRAYEDGNGVPQDDALALAWYTQAAEGGDAIASLRLMMAYSLGGLGVSPSPERAEYFSKLADRHGSK